MAATELAAAPAEFAPDFARRRTFAIISHPDAGKTTLTEKLLFAAGAIRLAGHVRARGERRRTRSERGEAHVEAPARQARPAGDCL